MGRGEFLEIVETTPGPAGPEPGSVIRDHVFFLERANQGLAAGEPESALRYYSRALSHCLQLEEAWVGQGLALLDLGEYEEAAIWAARALEHCPGSGPCFAVRAAALARMGLMEKAFGFLESAQRVRRDHWVVWFCRAEALLIADKLPLARHCLDKALELGGVARWWIMRRAGETFMLHDRVHDGLHYLHKALELEPREPMNHLRAAQALFLLGRRDQAREYTRRALELNPDHEEARRFQERLEKTGPLKRAWMRARGLAAR